MKKKYFPIALAGLLLIGCGGLTFIRQPTPHNVIEATWTVSPLPSPTLIDLASQTPVATHTATVSPTRTLLPTFTFTPTLTPIPPWIMQGPNEVIVPILLYHHIGIPQSKSLYYISPSEFERQMFLLREWGYQTISVDLLIRAIKEGAELPPKPIILTFDDGGETVFTNALPILQKYGFTGSAYIVHNYVGISAYMNAEQIRALYAAGWEIGSHSISHVDLTVRTDRQRDEIVDSRAKLQSLLGLPILTFAYPFGAYDRDALHYVHFAGYSAAMGLGNDSLQGNKNLFYLYRMAVNGDQNLESFALLLPWRGDLTNLTALTLVP
ncbi:MAG: polysaccharide deacetylase family protein [Chloroflexota bacterium]|nr:polysaccharide deacetylase family protein [Chloroflexota bacterium]